MPNRRFLIMPLAIVLAIVASLVLFGTGHTEAGVMAGIASVVATFVWTAFISTLHTATDQTSPPQIADRAPSDTSTVRIGLNYAAPTDRYEEPQKSRPGFGVQMVLGFAYFVALIAAAVVAGNFAWTPLLLFLATLTSLATSFFYKWRGAFVGILIGVFLVLLPVGLCAIAAYK